MKLWKHPVFQAVAVVLVTGLCAIHYLFDRAEGDAVADHSLSGVIEAYERDAPQKLGIDKSIPQFAEFPATGTIHWQEYHPVRGGAVLTGKVAHTDLLAYFEKYCDTAAFNKDNASWGWNTQEEAELYLQERPDLKCAELWGAFLLPSETGNRQMFLSVDLTEKRFRARINY